MKSHFLVRKITTLSLSLLFSSIFSTYSFADCTDTYNPGEFADFVITGTGSTQNISTNISTDKFYGLIIDCGTGSTINVVDGITITMLPGSIVGAVLTIPYNGNGDYTGTFNNEGTITGRNPFYFENKFGVINNGSTLGSTASITGTGDYIPAILTTLYNDVGLDKIVNYGVISATGTGSAAIRAEQSKINTITNYGSIISASGYGITTNDWGVMGLIETLNNLQGVGNVNGALTYSGNLPTNYNIIINSSTQYGQLSASAATGALTFGISPLSGKITQTTYTSVLSGLNVGNLSNTSGTYLGANWSLINSSGSIWDLVFASLPVLGPSAEDTLASMQPNASAMKNAFNSQYATLAYGLNHDCTIFDTNGVCVSVFGRNTSLNDSSYDNNAAGLVLGYKPHAQFRIGTYIDQSLNSNTTSGVKVERSNPDVGVFGVWNMNADGSGLELRAAANYGKRDLNVTRSVVGDSSAEAGSGKSDLNAYGALLEASYAYAMNDSWLAKLYAGVRYLSIKRDSYTERMTDDVSNPLSYSGLEQETTSAVVGVRFNGKLAPKVMASLNAGLEHDLHHSIDDYRATGVDDLGTINMDSQKDRTRPTAGVGISYDLADKQRLAANVQYRKEVFMSESSTTGQVTYTIGF